MLRVDVKAAVTAKLLANVAQSGHPSAAEHVERILAGGATADLPPDSAGFTALALDEYEKTFAARRAER